MFRIMTPRDRAHSRAARQFGVHRLQIERPDRPAHDLFVLDQLGHDLTREVDRDREADALIAAGLAVDLAVDADQLAARVDERAAGVARIDGGVGLDEVVVAGELRIVPVGRRDDAKRHRLAERERVADREHPFGDAQLARVAPRQRREPASVDLDDGQIGVRIGADDGALQLAIVRQRDRDRRRRALPTTWLLVST